MKHWKQVLLGLLSLFLIVMLVVGILFGQRFLLASTPKDNYTTFKPEKKDPSSSSVEVAEKAVLLLEEKQTPESLKVAKESVEKLSKSKDKSSLLARISVIQAKIKNQEILAEAQRAVDYLEGNPDVSNISLAQEKVNSVTEPIAKKTLQERIHAVQSALEKAPEKAADNAVAKVPEAQIIHEAPAVTAPTTPTPPPATQVVPSTPAPPSPPSTDVVAPEEPIAPPPLFPEFAPLPDSSNDSSVPPSNE